MATEKEEIEVATQHPMENLLDIEEGSTMVPAIQRNTDLVVDVQYDDKDVEIEEQFQEVYDLALEAFEAQSAEAELVEGKYKARNGEIAAQYLNTALNAAKEKSSQKMHKDKTTLAANKVTSPTGMTQNNLIVGDRNDILKTLMNNSEPEPIDVTPTDTSSNETE